MDEVKILKDKLSRMYSLMTGDYISDPDHDIEDVIKKYNEREGVIINDVIINIKNNDSLNIYYNENWD